MQATLVNCSELSFTLLLGVTFLCVPAGSAPCVPWTQLFQRFQSEMSCVLHISLDPLLLHNWTKYLLGRQKCPLHGILEHTVRRSPLKMGGQRALRIPTPWYLFYPQRLPASLCLCYSAKQPLSYSLGPGSQRSSLTQIPSESVAHKLWSKTGTFVQSSSRMISRETL